MISKQPLRYSNLSKEKWLAVRSITDYHNIVIKKADKCSCVIIWDRSDYLIEVEKQLNDKAIYKDVIFNTNIVSNLTEKSKKIVEDSGRGGCDN